MTFTEIQTHIEDYFDTLRLYSNKIFTNEIDKDSKLYIDMNTNIVEIYELQNDGSIRSTIASFSIVMYQYLTKIEQFIHIDEVSFKKLFKDFRITPNMKSDSNVIRDAWYLITNSN